MIGLLAWLAGLINSVACQYDLIGPLLVHLLAPFKALGIDADRVGLDDGFEWIG